MVFSAVGAPLRLPSLSTPPVIDPVCSISRGLLGGAAATVTGLAGGMLLGTLLASLLGAPAEAASGPAESEQEMAEEVELAGEEEEW